MTARTKTPSQNRLERLYFRALELICSSTEPRLSLHEFADECGTVAPHQAWADIKRLDINADLAHHERWIRSIFEKEPPPSTVNGLWFGISDPFVGVGYELYLCGSSRYDVSDVEFDWAALPDYQPRGSYSQSEVFHALWKPARQGELPYQLVDDAVPLLYAGLVVNWLAGRLPQTLLGNARSRAIAAGHDEGDPFLLGTVDSTGYHKTPYTEALEALKAREQRIERFTSELERRESTTLSKKRNRN